MKIGEMKLTLPLLFALAACAGGGLREVRGVRFQLSSKEMELADQYEREEPKSARAIVRCDYWTQRKYGNGIYAFATLPRWINAEQIAHCAVHVKAEKQPGSIVVYSKVEGHGIVTTVSRQMSCRETRFDADQQPFERQPAWQTCEAEPLNGTVLHLAFDDGQEASATTDAAGSARFDLSSIGWSDDALKSGQARLVLLTGERYTVSIAELPKYLEWQSARAAQQKLEQGNAAFESAKTECERAETPDSCNKLYDYTKRDTPVYDPVRAKDAMPVLRKSMPKISDKQISAMDDVCRHQTDAAPCADLGNQAIDAMNNLGAQKLLLDVPVRVARIRHIVTQAKTFAMANARRVEVDQQSATAAALAQCGAGDQASCHSIGQNASVTNILVDPSAFDKSVVILRNVVVHRHGGGRGTINDYLGSEAGFSQNYVWVQISSDSPRSARAGWMNLPGDDCVVLEVLGLLVIGNAGQPLLLLLGIGGGARL